MDRRSSGRPVSGDRPMIAIDHENIVRNVNEEIELARRKGAKRTNRYGYSPVIGYAPSFMTALVSIAGIVLSCVFSLLYLIMYVAALILLIILLSIHQVDDNTQRVTREYSKALHSEAWWLVVLLWAAPFLGPVGAYYFGTTSDPTTAITVAFAGATLLTFAMLIKMRKRKPKETD